MTTTREEEVMALEKRFWKESGDPSFFQSVMTEDAITIMEPMGFVSKARAVEMTQPGISWSNLEMEDVRFVYLTPDCIALAYHAKATNDKTGESYRGSINSVYVRKNGVWQLGMSCHQPWLEKKG